MPALAPHSMDMLAIVIRPSMERLRIASPRYSTMWPRPPPVPTCAISASTRSLAVTPGRSSPVTLTAIVFGRACGSVWVASTCSTSLVPMPNASAPNAPWVAVCESPQTIVMPGWVRPSCGPITCTMPWLSSPRRCSRTPNSAQLRRSVSICVREVGSAIVSRIAAAAVERRVGVPGRGVVVLGRERQVGPPDPAAGGTQAVEGLRAGHLVQQVQVDEEQIRLALGGSHDVGVPDLLGQGPGVGWSADESALARLPPSGHPKFWEVCFGLWDTV